MKVLEERNDKSFIRLLGHLFLLSRKCAIFTAYYGIITSNNITFTTQLLRMGNGKITRNAHFTGIVRSFEYDTSFICVPRHYSPKVVRIQYLCGLRV